MPVGEDEVDATLRRLRQDRDVLVDKLANGSASTGNEVGGYMHTVGIIAGLDLAEKIIKDVWRSWLPGSPDQLHPVKRNMSDY